MLYTKTVQSVFYGQLIIKNVNAPVYSRCLRGSKDVIHQDRAVCFYGQLIINLFNAPVYSRCLRGSKDVIHQDSAVCFYGQFIY